VIVCKRFSPLQVGQVQTFGFQPRSPQSFNYTSFKLVVVE
jgi:hypothetical protein